MPLDYAQAKDTEKHCKGLCDAMQTLLRRGNMHSHLIQRAIELQRRMTDETIDAVLLTDPDSIYYISGYCG